MYLIEIEFACSLIGVALFRFGNPHKKFLNLISICVAGLFLSQLLYYYSNGPYYFYKGPSPQALFALSTGVLCIAYALRFYDKKEKRIIDYMKLTGLVLLAAYPIIFYYTFGISNRYVWELRTLTFPILITIYIYDRWILKPEEMKKKFLIILVAQSLLIVVLLVFSFVQKASADQAREEAVMQKTVADENIKKCLELTRHLENKH